MTAQRLVKTILLISMCCLFPFSANALPIDLSSAGGFVASDSSLVSYGPTTNNAVLYEDSFSGVTFLSNDPFLGDPGILIPSGSNLLQLNMSFSTSGNDSFEFRILDPAGGQPYYDLFHDGTIFGAGLFNYGDISVDLVALGLVGTTVGMEFIITSNLGDTTFDGTLVVGNIRLGETNPVPEPATLLLFGSGLAGLAGFRKKFRK